MTTTARRALCLLVPFIAVTLAQAPSVHAKVVAVGVRPVTFTITNSNSSRAPCAADGRRYQLRGHLVAPRSALRGRRLRAATLYVHGLSYSEFYWRFTAIPGYDHARELARKGKASIVLDRLGYGASGKPHGLLSCIGAAADAMHQVVTQLRSGSYAAGVAAAIPIGRIALAGDDVGGLIAELEAISYGDVDALIVTSWADQGLSTLAIGELAKAGIVCAIGGDRSDGASGPGGYAFVGQAPDFFNADPAVVAAASALVRRNPCGELATAPTSTVLAMTGLAEITVPVLLVYGDRDAVFGQPSAGKRQRALYRGARDVTLAFVPGTGHALAFERTAPQFRAIVRRWLELHGF